eukprot:COSAG01_NODE_6223_length_3781_cov_8.767789_2_plen_133_part_00
MPYYTTGVDDTPTSDSRPETSWMTNAGTDRSDCGGDSSPSLLCKVPRLTIGACSSLRCALRAHSLVRRLQRHSSLPYVHMRQKFTTEIVACSTTTGVAVAGVQFTLDVVGFDVRDCTDLQNRDCSDDPGLGQ